MILTLNKYHENLLRESILSLPFIVKFLPTLETKMILTIPNETFLRITRYRQEPECCIASELAKGCGSDRVWTFTQ